MWLDHVPFPGEGGHVLVWHLARVDFQPERVDEAPGRRAGRVVGVSGRFRLVAVARGPRRGERHIERLRDLERGGKRPSAVTAGPNVGFQALARLELGLDDEFASLIAH